LASTITLQRTVNLASIFTRLAPNTGVGGFTNEPALSNGDWVRQFILAPPFAWRWNRATTTFNTIVGTQDYQISLANFGWLEKATLKDPNGNYHELQVMLNLGEESTQNLPVSIAPRLDDDAGNITFRLMPVPDVVYTVALSYQKAAVSFSALTDLWSPIPDYLSYLINQGFLAKTYEYLDDQRFVPTMQMFMRQVIAANEGLKDSQIDLFLSERINSMREMQSQLGNSQSARQARGAF